MAGAARLPHQAAFHSELLPASQSDRAAMGPDAQKRYAQQMLCNLCAIRRRGARFPARTSSSQLGALLRFGHRQLPRHLAQELSGHDVNGVYLERRDPEFKQKMAEVLCVYREVKLIKETAATAKQERSDAVAILSYDEKPGIQAIANTAPDLPPEPGRHATFARDHEYKRHGTVSLLAGIDLLTGQVHALVRDRHRSREFIRFLKLLDAAYPAHTAIKLILDNHSAHISKETKAWRPLRIHFHAQAWFLAQPRRGLFLQARPLRAAPYPRRIQTGTQGPHHGR